MYIASSQFYRMLLKRNPPIQCKEISNPADAIACVEYIENKFSSAQYEECRAEMQAGGESTEEALLFHGTDSSNIDTIFRENFNIDCSPVGRNKAMAYGRGVYMSEYPGVRYILHRLSSIYIKLYSVCK